MGTEINERRRINREYKRMDKHYHCINYTKKGKTYKIESHSSPVLTNGHMRHATSGAYLEHRVGSKYDDLYFIVSDSTAPPCEDYLEPRKLYYNNPEEFERHRLTRRNRTIEQNEYNCIRKGNSGVEPGTGLLKSIYIFSSKKYFVDN